MHVVRKGDTLWDLASFYLTDPFLWPEIYRLNTVVVEDPHWIYPSERLTLPGPGEIPIEARVPGEEVRVPTPGVEIPPQVMGELRSIFATREVTGESLVYEPTPPVPALAVNEMDFYRSGMLVQLAELGPRGKLVDVIEPSNVELGEPTPNRYTRIYVSHPGGEPPQPGDRMLIWRVDRRLKPYGHVVRPTGMATVAAVHEDVSTAVIVEVFDRVQLGNQLSLIQPFHMERGVFAAPVAAGPTGELVALLDEQVMPTVEDIAFVNVGLSEGVALGDEFEIYLAIRRSREELRLPEEHIATGRVVRVTEETSTLRVIEQRHPAIRAGLPVRLVRKMPS